MDLLTTITVPSLEENQNIILKAIPKDPQETPNTRNTTAAATPHRMHTPDRGATSTEIQSERPNPATPDSESNPVAMPTETMCTKSSPAPSSNPTALASTPTIQELNALCLCLARLARTSYTTKMSRRVISYDYMRAQTRVTKFFERAGAFDFLADGTYGLCLEMRCLAELIEINVRTSSDFKFKTIPWPTAELSAAEEHALTRAVYAQVDSLIWGRGLKVMKTEKRKEEKPLAYAADSGYSTGDM